MHVICYMYKSSVATKRNNTQNKLVVLREEGYSTTYIATRVKGILSADSETLSKLIETGSVG